MAVVLPGCQPSQLLSITYYAKRKNRSLLPLPQDHAGREALRQAVSPFLFSPTAKDSKRQQAPNKITAAYRDDITLVLLRACQAVRDRLG